MNAPDIPLIIGGLGDFLGKEGFGKSCTEYNFINQELLLKPLTNENELLNLIHARNHTKTEKIYIKSMDFALGKISYDEFTSLVMKINND